MKVGGVVRAESIFRGNAPSGVANQFAYNLAGQVYTRDIVAFRAREYLNVEGRSATVYGDLRAFASIRFTDDSAPPGPFGGGKIAVAGLPVGAKANAGLFQGLTNDQVYVEAAFVQWAGLTAGVTQSFFDFYTQYYEISANSFGISRQPLDLIAYTAKFGGFSATVSVEDAAARRIGNSTADTTPGDVNPAKPTTAAFLTYGAIRAPEAVANIRYEGRWGLAHIAGALHEVNSNPITLGGGMLPVGSTPSTAWGYALDIGVKVKLDDFSTGDNLTAQATYAKGAMDYANPLNHFDGTSSVFYKSISISVPVNDGLVLPNGSIGLSEAAGAFFGYQHFWTPSIRSDLFGSYLQINNPGAAQMLSAGADNATVWDIGFNTLWSPVKALDLGAEAIYTNLHLSGAFPLATATTLPSGAKGPTPANSNDLRGRLRIQLTF